MSEARTSLDSRQRLSVDCLASLPPQRQLLPSVDRLKSALRARGTISSAASTNRRFDFFLLQDTGCNNRFLQHRSYHQPTLQKLFCSSGRHVDSKVDETPRLVTCFLWLCHSIDKNHYMSLLHLVAVSSDNPPPTSGQQRLSNSTAIDATAFMEVQRRKRRAGGECLLVPVPSLLSPLGDAEWKGSRKDMRLFPRR